MRKLCLFFCILFLFILCACNAKIDSQPQSPEITPSKSEEPVYTIETKFYTITLPAEWESKCTYEIAEQADGTYLLHLYEITSHAEIDAGKLCSIMLLPTTEDWKDLPNYTIHGILYTPEGDYQLIALFPTDAQFTEATREAYNALSEKIIDVLYCITPTVGTEMVAPAPTL